jgi:hypothetical protein
MLGPAGPGRGHNAWVKPGSRRLAAHVRAVGHAHCDGRTGHCRTVLEGSWENPGEAQVEGQTRFRPAAASKGENVLRGRMNAVRTLNAEGPVPRERIYCGARGGWKKSDDERWPSAAVAEKKQYSSP